MKLIYCPRCQDVLKFGRNPNAIRYCFCGASWGYYVNSTDAVCGGACIPLGLGNTSFANALRMRPKEGRGSEFSAWVMALEVPSIKVEK